MLNFQSKRKKNFASGTFVGIYVRTTWCLIGYELSGLKSRLFLNQLIILAQYELR